MNGKFDTSFSRYRADLLYHEIFLCGFLTWKRRSSGCCCL